MGLQGRRPVCGRVTCTQMSVMCALEMFGGADLLVRATASSQRHQRHFLRLKVFSNADQLQEPEAALVHPSRIDGKARWRLQVHTQLLYRHR